MIETVQRDNCLVDDISFAVVWRVADGELNGLLDPAAMTLPTELRGEDGRDCLTVVVAAATAATAATARGTGVGAGVGVAGSTAAGRAWKAPEIAYVASEENIERWISIFFIH